MNCPDRSVLLAFCTGELPEPSAEEVISHISVCPDCQATLHALGEAEDTLAARLRSPAVEDPYKDEPQRAELMARAMAIVTGGSPVSDRPRPETPEPAVLGRLGEYELLAKLGEGGMGTVYKARQTRLKKIVALKVLPKERTTDPQAVTRFEREMEAVGQLSHPNIVQAHDARDIESTTVLVMEYVDGKDLGDLLKCVKSLRIPDACEVVCQAALGLQYAHENGLVHRDIKPSNLMLARQGQVKILDLGLARLGTEKPDSVELTSSGAAMGTADYMAPEQASDAHTADARADIYSLGCTLYKLLTGHAPFSGPNYPTEMKKILAHLTEPVPQIRGLRADVPEALAAVIDRMLAMRPEDRLSTAAEVVAALAPFAAGCDLARVLAEAAASAEGAVARDKSLAATEPMASSGVVGTDANQAPLSPSARGAGGEGGRHEPGKVPLSLRERVGVRGMIALGLFTVVVLGVVIMLRTSKGTLEIETDDPNVQVAVKQNGEVVEVVDAKSGWKITLKSGQYDLALQGSADQVQLDQDSVVVKRGDTVKVRVTVISNPKSEISNFESPPPPLAPWEPQPGAPAPAVAPFDEKKAKEYQAAWAKYLVAPVEITNSIGMKLVLIPPGEFTMGSPKELIEQEEDFKRPDTESQFKDCLLSEVPAHRVRITRPSYFARYHVTQEEYQRVTGMNPSYYSAAGKGSGYVGGQDTKRFPVESVSSEEATEFCRKLSNLPEEKAAGRTYCLPSEAQWEYACRAGSAGRFSFNADGRPDDQELRSYAWFEGGGSGRPHAVGLMRPNAFGLHDMHGNVWEWCQDWYGKDYYAKSPADDPAGPAGGSLRVIRGGCNGAPAGRCRSAFRSCFDAGERGGNPRTGFRVSLILAEAIGPIVPATRVPLDLKPDTKAWDLKPGSPLNRLSLVLKPAAVKDLRSWTLETCASRGGADDTGQLSPDGRLYATCGRDGVIRFLDPASGKLRIALVNPELNLTAPTWSPDSTYVAVGCANGMVRIWNVAKGTLVIGPTSFSTKQVSSLAWSPDGTVLAIARNGKSTVVLWDVRQARQSAVVQEPADENQSVNFLAWSADGKKLMTTTDSAVQIWAVAGARLVRTFDLQSPEDQVRRRAAAWSPDGKRIATLRDDGTVKFFDSTYKPVASGRIRDPVWWQPSIAWSPDGLHFAGSWFNGCDVLNTANGQREFGVDGLEWGDGSSGLSWSLDSARLFCTHKWGGAVTATDAISGKALWELAGKIPFDGYETGVCISPDGRQYATAVWKDRLYIWNAMQGVPVHECGPTFPGGGQVSWSKDGRLAAASGYSCDNDRGGCIWDPEKPGQSHFYRDDCYRCAVWSPDGKILARGGKDVLLWTSGSEDPHQVFHPDAEVWRLAWFANNSTLAAGLDNNKVLILEMPSGKVLRTLQQEEFSGGIRCLAALPDGRLIAASRNGVVSVWNSKGEVVGYLAQVGNSVNDGTIPAGGMTIAFATSDGIVLWDADKQVVQGKIGTGKIYSVAWSLPLHRLIAAQEDRLAIYDVPSGELLASQIIWYGPGKYLLLSPEGHMRCSEKMSEDVVYVALTDDGRQITLRQPEFAAAYGWTNDPQKIRLTSAAAVDKPQGGKETRSK